MLLFHALPRKTLSSWEFADRGTSLLFVKLRNELDSKQFWNQNNRL